MSKFDIQEVSWTAQNKDIVALRQKIFIHEQEVPESEEWDEYDAHPATQHVIVYSSKSHIPLAYGRLQQNGKLGRICVLREYRHAGIATLLIEYLLKLANKNGISQPFLYSQTDVVPLYKKLGFSRIGEEFMEAGIAHIKMVRQANRATNNPPELLDDSVIRFDSFAEFQMHFHKMAKLARKELRIFSQELSPTMYGDNKTTHFLSELARASRYANLRILVLNTKPLIGKRHPIVSLYQRLPTKLNVKKCTLEPEKKGESYVIFDNRYLIYLNDEESCYGFANYDAKAEVKNLIESFEYLWQSHSVDEDNFKSFSL